MSDVAVIAVSSTRVRAASLASGALVVVCICLALLALSRVTAYLERPPIQAVQIEIAPRETPRAEPAPGTPPAPRAAVDPSAAPAETDIPVDRAMFARTLRCFSLRAGEPRPPECPAPTPQQLESAGGDFPTPRELRLRTNPPQNSAQVSAGIPPPCNEGLNLISPTQDAIGGQACIHGGLVPQERARSPIEICESGGLGPCRPPPFRAEDVQRLPHTQ